jgi:molecular chaperone DnaJ
LSSADYYEVLGVERTASPDEIKRAYRRLAMDHHPDRNPNDPGSEEKFKQATEAYEVLRDPDRRARYDRFGHAGLGGGPAGFEDFDLSDALRAFMRDFGGFEDLFAQGARRAGPRGPLRGSDVQVRLTVTLEEVATGVEKTIQAKLLTTCEACKGKGSPTDPATCPTCAGEGEVRQTQRSIFGHFVSVRPCSRCNGEGRIITDPCRECGGEGRVREDRRIKVQIPAGVETGNYLTLRGEGNAGPRGGPPGDLLIVIEVEPHDVFERRGEDVLYDLAVSVPRAALGGVVEVPTLLGTVELEIPPGTQTGTILRIRGEGVASLGRSGRGDQLVQITAWVPTRLSEEEQRQMEALAESENFVPPEREKGFWKRMKEAFTA